ncbi:hydroxyacylglutathione hydrolase [Congregibacter brevis]|uniref:Hydroxyacylglutathione hydrolase n=1 Tax=Congregibacter brevis TaxID=3081201 RepID=A0ABZ0I9X0_9GAMM|nr:hydroxyacylglutathione hydrolase [Congregibacter sp. IMCC45268]
MSSTVANTMPSIVGLPAFSDNYIWLLRNSDRSALVVDPGDAAPVEAALKQYGLSLSGILITHHHFDHVGGLKTLKSDHECPVYGPANPNIDGIDIELGAGDHIVVGDYSFDIITVPGHTLDHIAYYRAGEEPAVFCGDTLFAGGCGRIFEGNPGMMHESLHRLAALPPETAVYCAHEYTLANLAFARAADPDNDDLQQREAKALALRAKGIPTVPSTIALELATNPFLRSADAQLAEGLESTGRGAGGDPVEVFAGLRAWKDQF